MPKIKEQTKEPKVNLIKHPQWVKIFEDTGYGEDFQPIIGFSTTCCAMFILSIKNYHTLEQIRDVIDWIRKDSYKQNWTPANRKGGEKNLMVIVSPGEFDLEENLNKLGFKLLTDEMKRREGYPKPNQLSMYMLTLD